MSEALERAGSCVPRSFLLKEKRREVKQVIAPDEPGVQAGSFDLRDRHLFCLEEVDQFAIGLDEIVFGSAGDPEKAKVGVFGVERRELLRVVEIVDRGAEAADPGELAGVCEADFETFQTAHRE